MQEDERRLAAAAYRPHPLRLIDFARRRPVTVGPDTSIGTALAVMEENRIGSVVVTDTGSRRPVGIFTLRDVLCRIAIPRFDIDRSIESVMTRDPVSVPATLSVPQAAQEMARLDLRHLLITGDDGALAGIVSRTDIYDWMCDSCASLRKAKLSRPREGRSIPSKAGFFGSLSGDAGLS